MFHILRLTFCAICYTQTFSAKCGWSKKFIFALRFLFKFRLGNSHAPTPMLSDLKLSFGWPSNASTNGSPNPMTSLQTYDGIYLSDNFSVNETVFCMLLVVPSVRDISLCPLSWPKYVPINGIVAIVVLRRGSDDIGLQSLKLCKRVSTAFHPIATSIIDVFGRRLKSNASHLL